MRDLMVPMAAVLTPNVREAEILSGVAIKDITTMHLAARTMVDMGARAVLVKGGRLGGATSIDVLCHGNAIREFSAPRVAANRPHGTGCTLSAAIAAELARGSQLEDAIQTAKLYVTRALATAERVGHGATPLNHLIRREEITERR